MKHKGAVYLLINCDWEVSTFIDFDTVSDHVVRSRVGNVDVVRIAYFDEFLRVSCSPGTKITLHITELPSTIGG